MDELDATDEFDSDLQTAQRDFSQLEKDYYKVNPQCAIIFMSMLIGRRVFAKGPTLAGRGWLKKVSTADIAMESRME